MFIHRQTTFTDLTLVERDVLKGTRQIGYIFSANTVHGWGKRMGINRPVFNVFAIYNCMYAVAALNIKIKKSKTFIFLQNNDEITSRIIPLIWENHG